ncbi:MAG: F510_1955 family glycosylhydrolase [Acidimicrobiia bacterium]
MRPAATLAVESWGAGPPVLLVHGLGASARYWHRLRDTEPAFRATAVDLLGFGRSPKPADADYDVDAHVAGLVGVLDGPAVVVGHSAGAVLASALAADHPGLVAGVVLVGLPAYPDTDTARRDIGSLGLLARLTVDRRPAARWLCTAMCRLRPLAVILAPRVQRDLPQQVASDGARHTWPSYSRTLERVVVEHRVADDLGRSSCPVRLLHGRATTPRRWATCAASPTSSPPPATTSNWPSTTATTTWPSTARTSSPTRSTTSSPEQRHDRAATVAAPQRPTNRRRPEAPRRDPPRDPRPETSMSTANNARRTRRPAPDGTRRKAWVLAALVAVAATPVVVWALTTEPAADAPGAVEDPGVAHVHGLGVNPADGALFVATHYGMFRIAPDGPAERVGDSYQDTMGFTVIGPDRFLGSGHPDLASSRDGLPGRLGLIESADAGRTWQPMSLLGDADFHGLAFAHDRVYGWDAGTGRFMVSADLESWETRSTLDLFGFAVDPDDADHVIGATPDGLVESADGGRSWQRTDGPPLVGLAWDADAGLWGVDPAGGVHHADGSRWQAVGRLPGTPQALLATDDGLFAAAHDDAGRTGVYRSDRGSDWELLHRDDTP